MKKYLSLFFASVLLVLHISAQNYQLPNSNMETFQSSWAGVGYDPTDWKGANVRRTVMGITAEKEMVSSDENGRSGKCVRIHNEKVEAFGIGAVAPSWITLGQPWNDLKGTDQGTASAGTDGGMAFTYRPDTLSAWIKSARVGGEEFNIVFYSWTGTAQNNSYKGQNGSCQSYSHTDEESDIRVQTDGNACGTGWGNAVQVGEGAFRSTQNYSSWTQVKIPITYYNNTVPEKTNVIFSSGKYPHLRESDGVNVGSTLWVDDISLIYSSKLHEIRIIKPGETTERPITGVAPNIQTYHYSLGLGATNADIPQINCYRSGRLLGTSECVINYATQLGEPTTITVSAEDGSSTTTYTVVFAAQMSDNARPAGITVNGTPVNGFSGYVNTYDVALPYGTTDCPVLDIVKAEPEQTFTSTCTGVPGVATIEVTAADGTSKQTYTLNLSVAPLTDNTLQDILINDKPLTGFSPTKNIYKVELPIGTTDAPSVTPVSAYPDGAQTITVNNGGLEGTTTITVTPPSGTSRTYSITYVITESSYSFLEDIQIGGVSLPDFNPEVLNYSYSLPLGVTALPEITYTQGDEYQTVLVEEGGIDGVTKITVTAQNGTKTIYRISFSAEKSSVSTLADIKVGGTSIPGFASEKTNYTYTLPVGTTDLPEITYTQGDEYQTVTLTPGSVNGITRLIVKAQDGTTTTYTIVFSVEQASVATLLDIQIGGLSMPGFEPTQPNYTYVLPRGTQELPEITYTLHDDYQTVRITEGGVEGDTRITVRAQSGDIMVYTIHFTIEKSSVAILSDIKIDGVSLPGFSPEILEYSYELAGGTTELPAITWVKGDEYQQVLLQKGTVNGASTIRVQAEDGTVKQYVINFSVQKSENAKLQNIYVDGVPLPGFEQETFSYVYALPMDAMTCPTITVEKMPGQTVRIIQPQLTGTARIEVQPEVGAINVYTILFRKGEEANTTLLQLSLNGTPIPDFRPDSLYYEYVLPYGTNQLPEITYTLADENSVVYEIPDGITQTILNVVSADGTSNTVYEIQYKQYVSTDQTLSDIKVDGTSLEDFLPTTYQYSYELEAGTLACPPITVEKANPSQIVLIQAPRLDGVAEIRLVDANQETLNTYTINFILKKDTVTSLQNILLDGQPLTDFDPAKKIYEVQLLAEDKLPTITYERGHDRQNVFVSYVAREGIDLLVTAENGNTATYTIHFNVPVSSSALLADLQVYDEVEQKYVSLADFDANVFEYTDTLPWRTDRVPNIRPIFQNKYQIATIAYQPVNNTTVVEVLAQDGTTKQTYQIAFPVEQSKETALASLIVDGNPLVLQDGVFDYSVQLPYGTTVIPEISWEKKVSEQRISLTESGLAHPAVLKVFAENGDSALYNIHFEVLASDAENVLTRILVNGMQPADFSPTADNCSLVLPYGTETVPEITYTKSYPEQTVEIVQGKLGEPVYIKVRSNKEGVADKQYTLSVSVADQSEAVLTDIRFDGVSMEGFDAKKTTYVRQITQKPALIEAVAPEGVNVVMVKNDLNCAVFEAQKDEASTTYTIYFHYTDDVIPNADFTEWTTAQYNNGPKPVGWMVPADCADSYTFNAIILKGTYYTGKEVYQQDDYMVLDTYYKVNMGSGEGNNYSISGSIPGMICLGDMSLTLKSSGNSTSSTSGGIIFRNTIDSITMDYNPVAASGIDNMRFLVRYIDEQKTYEQLFTDNQFTDTWKTMSMSLLGNTISNPEQLHITINSSHTENASGLNGTATNYKTSKVYVKRLNYFYSSLISSATLNGMAATVDGSNITFNLDAETDNVENIVIQGQVPDQEYFIQMGEEVWTGSTNLRTGSIKAVAEDGSYTEYAVYMYRPRSANAQLSYIKVNGQDIAFDPSQLEYDYEVPFNTTILPDIQVGKASKYQTVELVRQEMQGIQINVTAEDGQQQTYIVNFVKEQPETDATLSMLTVEGYELDFNPEQYEYTVQLPVDTKEIPAVTYEKQMDDQEVVFTEGDANGLTTLAVTAQDGTTQNTYKIQFTLQEAVSDAQLSSMQLLSDGVILFDSDTYVYEHHVLDTLPAVTYSGNIHDQMTVIHYPDSIIWNLSSSTANHKYLLEFTRTLSSNANLHAIIVNEELLEGFVPSVYDYQLYVQRGQSFDIVPIIAEEEQKVETTYADSVYTIKVTAEDLTEQVTHLTLKEQLSSDATLAGLEISLADGTPISFAFDPQQLEYEFAIPCDSPKYFLPQLPDVIAYAATEGQTIQMELNALNSNSYIVVTSQDGKQQQTYTLKFNVAASSNAYLSGIAIDNIPIESFMPDVYRYEIEVPSGSTVPTVTYTCGDAFQSVETETGSDLVVLQVTAENGNMSTYLVRFNITLSSVADLGGITIDGQPLPDFDKDQTLYTVNLPVGTVTLPEIGVISGADNQKVSVVSGGVNGATQILVTAENGNTKNYTINFVVQQSENVALASILIDYLPLPDFDPEVLEYTVELPVGTNVFPDVTWMPGDEYQTVIGMTNPDGDAIIKVTAQNPQFTRQYIVHFNVLKSENALLSNIYLNNEPLTTHAQGFTSDADFSPEHFEYHVDLPVGTLSYPKISFDMGDEWQKVEVSQLLADSVVLTVTSQDEAHTNSYVIHFNILQSDVAFLFSIELDGMPLPDFHPDTLHYEVLLPVGTVRLPAITWTKGDAHQTVSKTDNGVNGRCEILVEAQDRITTRTYTIDFSVSKSDNAYLKEIKSGGVLLEGFDPEISEYVITLPYGTEEVPVTTYTLAESAQEVSLREAQTVNDTTYLVVTAEDGVGTFTYVLTYKLRESSNALLDAIYIDEQLLSTEAQSFESDADFTPENMEYHIVLPPYTSVLPEVTWKAQVPESEVTSFVDACTDCQFAQGTVRIQVVAQDGSDANEYTIFFTTRLSNNVMLEDIRIDGKTIDGFKSDSTEYVLEFPVGTDSLAFPTPEQIEVTLAEEGQTYMVSDAGNGVILIQVTAPDGVTIGNYVIVSTIKLSDNAYLSDLRLNGVTLQGFDSTVFEYSYILPYGDVQIPLDKLEYTSADPYQEISVVSSGNIADGNAVINIFVVAQDGTENIYIIRFTSAIDDPNQYPSSDDVCLVQVENGVWRASSIRKDVIVFLFNVAGQRIDSGVVPVIDPNEKDFMCEPSSTVTGREFRLPKQGTVYVFTFTYQGIILRSQKVIY